MSYQHRPRGVTPSGTSVARRARTRPMPQPQTRMPGCPARAKASARLTKFKLKILARTAAIFNCAAAAYNLIRSLITRPSPKAEGEGACRSRQRAYDLIINDITMLELAGPTTGATWRWRDLTFKVEYDRATFKTRALPTSQLKAQPGLMPSFLRITAAGQKPVNPVCSRFKPTTPVNSSHHSEKASANTTLSSTIKPAKDSTALSMFIVNSHYIRH